ncbi:MAG: DNA-directed RNA polymerase subunit beta, partial [Nitrospinota bacterium]
IMTDVGTFIVNGSERVVVSQLHRSPGAFFTSEKGKGSQSGQLTYSARLIPYRGSWLDFEFDIKDILHARIDRRRKFPATTILKALGYEEEELLNNFYNSTTVSYNPSKDEFTLPVQKELLGLGILPAKTIKGSDGSVIVKNDKKLTKKALRLLESNKIKSINIHAEDLLGKCVASDIINKETGEVLIEIKDYITEDHLDIMRMHQIEEIKILLIEKQGSDSSFRDTLAADKVAGREDALKEIYKRMRPGDSPTLETAQSLFDSLFFSSKRYDLSGVGRLKLNERLGLDYPLTQRTLTRDDILLTLKELFNIKNGLGSIDDIDHLGNRRVRSVGESIENQFRVGLVRMEKTIIERMNMGDLDACMPHDLINSKPVTAAVKEFFGSSQLSQFMDQTNPLSAITHKRRLSALGPGGLTRERAGFEVRDVHPSHYGRICPIETPEGPNIGLISSLSTYARVNNFGFIETPYRKVRDSKVTDEIVYMSASDEDKWTIAQANAILDEQNCFTMDMISCRKGGGDYVLVPPEEVDFMDVSPKQLVSVAASLIPFLENDDANRALMGSNMQRQAVPLLKVETPLVGTGMEGKVAVDSGSVVCAKRSGGVISVDSSRIVIRADEEVNDDESQVDIYRLTKYARSNQNTCINHTPIVSKGQRVERGDVIADGQSTDRGELALGRNILVAFMPWYGYNFEDAIVVSEKLVKNDVFTSIHIEEFDVEARDTRQGKEEITRDIPNVGEAALKHLDASGIIRIGAKVKVGDILVGKVTPKGETILSPEEKLLKAIFGEKAGDMRDTSLKIPPGNEGIVIDVQVFTRRGSDKDERTISIEEEERECLEKDQQDEISIILDEQDLKLREVFVDTELATALTIGEDEELPAGSI